MYNDLNLTGQSVTLSFDNPRTIVHSAVANSTVVIPAIIKPKQMLSVCNKSDVAITLTSSTDEINYSQSEPASFTVPAGKVCHLESICLGMWSVYND